jgi:DnaA family protein
MNFSPQLPFDFSVSEHFTLANFLVQSRNAELVNLLKNLEHYTEPVAFVWGSEGCGKTHLLQAVCHDQQDRNTLHALYLPMANIRVFGPEVFASLHHMELICLDDLHLVTGDIAWEEALFEFFNRSREDGVRLLVSATQSPRGIDFALPDLASRMTWGVTYHLHELSDDNKLAAIDQRAREKNMPMPPEVLSYIFNRHPRDLQGLLAVIETLDKLSLAEKRRLTIPFVRKVLNWQ